MFKLIVAGSRSFNDYNLMKEKLDFFLSRKTDEEIIIVSGGADGADSLGERYAKEKLYKIDRYLADWNRYGITAGFIRNAQMAEVGDALVLFWDGKSTGSANMLRQAHMRNLPVKIVHFTPLLTKNRNNIKGV